MGKIVKISGTVLGSVFVMVLFGLILTGLYVGWGPFTFLQFDKQQKAILTKYPVDQGQGEIVFYGASAMTFNGMTYAEELFIEDGIHLNRDGQLRWCEEYICPALEELTATFGLDYLRKEQ